MSRRFRDKSVVVVGEGRGLPLACVRELLAEGAHIHAMSADRGELGALQQASPRQLHWVPTDLAAHSSIAAAFDRIGECCQRVDALVVDTLQFVPRSFEELTEQDVVSSLLVNIAGPVFCMQRAATLMRGGRVVFVSPAPVGHSLPGSALYDAVKAAMEALLSGVRHELFQSRAIQVTILRSGTEVGISPAGLPEAAATPPSMEHVVRSILFALSLPKGAGCHCMDLQSADAC